MVSWIPERWAVVGKTVDLKDSETEKWSRGWRVDTASGPAMEEKYLNQRSRDHTRQRRASDV